MGCAPSKNIDLTTEVSLYHFDLHRVVGKGSFGKVRQRAYTPLFNFLILLYPGSCRPA